MIISDNARKVLETRYLIKDEHGVLKETPDEMVRRVSDAVAAAELAYDAEADVKAVSDDFCALLNSLDFLPNSPTLMNAGKALGQLSACFVLPVPDSMEDIFETIKQAALIHKSGGGTGFSFSRLRPKGSSVNSTGGVASGPISFMKVFNMATEAVKQGGTRRGANMGILRVDHPDILDFICCKSNTSEITNFNISVGLTDTFMDALESGADYALIDPRSGIKVGSLNSAKVFDSIVDAAWKTGEPGIIFLDRLNRDNPVPSQGEIESTNPCGEQPLLPYESCNLGSVNLANMVTPSGDIDWPRLDNTVRRAVRFLDNVIDVNKYPLDKIADTTRKTRKIGLGVMGFADMLLLMNIPYASDTAVELADRIMGFIREKGRHASKSLAEKRGTFPLFSDSVFSPNCMYRNATITTIAPTGTLSIIAGVSSGIEPVFGYVFMRNIMDGTKMLEVNPILRDALTRRGLYSDALMEKIAEAGTVAHIDELPQDIRDVFMCSHDISPQWHIKMQAAFQRHTDNAVSKTVNFRAEATSDEVREVYLAAFSLGCKGVTIYRDGSRDQQVLSLGKSAGEKSAVSVPNDADRTNVVVRPRKRPSVTSGMTERMRIGCGNLYVTVNYDENGICEVFTNTGKAGGCPSQSEATARLVSIALRSGVDPDTLIDELRGIRCPSTIRMRATNQEIESLSCPDAMAKVIEKVYAYSSTANGNVPHFVTRPAPAAQASASDAAVCPECGAGVSHESGCVTCRSCGYSKCG